MKKMKLIRRVISALVILLLIIATMGVTDYRRTTHIFDIPIFARLNVAGAKKDGGSCQYKGIGYSIIIEGNFIPEDELKGVTHARFYVFGKEIRYAIRD